MRTIEVTAEITQEGKLTIEVPADIEPGEYHMVLVIDENQGDEVDIEEALDPEELAELKAAIAASEEEKARGFYVTEEQVRQKFAEKIANYRQKNNRVSA